MHSGMKCFLTGAFFSIVGEKSTSTWGLESIKPPLDSGNTVEGFDAGILLANGETIRAIIAIERAVRFDPENDYMEAFRAAKEVS